MGAVAVRRVLALPAAAESDGLTGFRIDFVRRGLPAHGAIIQRCLEKGSVSWVRWKVGGGRACPTDSSYTSREGCGLVYSGAVDSTLPTCTSDIRRLPHSGSP